MASDQLRRELPPAVLVLGATSLVGRFLMARLIAQGTQVVALSRKAQPAAGGISWITGDLENLDSGPTTLTPLAFSVSHVWLLPQALPALERFGVSRLVLFSSTSRFTKLQSPVPEERAVAQRIADAEHAVAAFCGSHGISWTILRPTVIYAEGKDRSVTRLANLIRRIGAIPLAGDGSGKRQPVHAEDLASGAIAAASAPKAENRAYDMPGGETLTYRVMCERIFQGMNRPTRIVSVPPVVWRLGFMVAGRLLPDATSAMGTRMSEDLTFDGTAAARDFGWSPRPFHPKFATSSLPPSNA